MGVVRLNHAVLFVRDLAASVEFYTRRLGFRALDDLAAIPGAAFLRAAGSTNDHDLGLFALPEGAPAAARGAPGLYHLAWEVDTLADLEAVAEQLQAAGALVGASDHGTTKSLYGRDPDGIEFEVVWLVPADRLDDAALEARTRIGRLDLRAEQERYGRDTPGGIGISRTAPSLPG